MNKKIVILLIALLLLVSCTIKSDVSNEVHLADNPIQSSIPKISFENMIPSSEPIISSDAADLLLVDTLFSTEDSFSPSYIRNWKHYIQENFGISIDIARYTDLSLDLITFLKNKEGIVAMYDINYLTSMIEANLIEPLNQYIIGNKQFNSSNDASFKRVSSDDGTIWAIPNTDSMSTMVRVYDRDSIYSTIGKVPETISDFYEYSFQLAKTGVKSVDSFTGTGYSQFTDIFTAYGLYIKGEQMINYSPLINKFEDIYFNDSIFQALEYINGLNQLGSIKLESIHVSDELISSKYTRSYQVNTSEYLGSFFLKGPNERYLIKKEITTNYFVMLKETYNKERMFDIFVDKFFSSEIGNLALGYGIPDISYKIIKDENSEKEALVANFKTEGINPIGFYCTNLLNKYIKTVNEIDESTFNEQERFYDYYEKTSEFKNLEYTLNLDQRFESSKEYNDLAVKSLKSLLIDSISVSDVISHYRDEFKKYGGIEILEELNVKIKN